MKVTDLTLSEQMHIDEVEIQLRKEMVGFGDADVELLMRCRDFIHNDIDAVIGEFYSRQTRLEEMARIIGDADTLERLHLALRGYVFDLFDGFYGLEYVSSRLRIGLVHQRIGVEPKLYSSSMHVLKILLSDVIIQNISNEDRVAATIFALDKLFVFDSVFVYDTHQRSLVNQLQVAREKADLYAHTLEKKVAQRTKELEASLRRDVLTDIHNRRSFGEQIRKDIAMLKRQKASLALVYFDVDDFKKINDQEGHLHGDDVLVSIGKVLHGVCREGDTPARYGGDEFCVILPFTVAAEAQLFCQRLLDAFHAEHDGKYSLSIGIAQSGPDMHTTVADLLGEADAAMYEAKRVAGSHIISRLTGLEAKVSAIRQADCA
ncbi:MAG: GGDEF domain-containing protein [Mariprofundaceae bacterium]|nr:GGDEF domain-containing protein [Mariprofundaceae bacterium]